MEEIKLPINKNICLLALGAESVGVFAVYQNGDVFISDNFGDLLDEDSFLKYKKAVSNYLKKEKIKLDIILTDFHPQYQTTILGEELSIKYKAKHIKIQHHIAHVFSAVGDYIMLQLATYNLQSDFFGLAMDGTGYGMDGNIWGGEIFQSKNVNIKMENDKLKCKINKFKNLEIIRIGSLEEQIMIGGDLAVKEPARMLVAILAKSKDQKPNTKTIDQILKTVQTKEDIYRFVKKYYTKNEFEVLYNQMEQRFNCQRTTSTGRVLDAVSVLLGFAGNERNYKHEATKKLEENSTKPYEDIKPQIFFSVIASDPPTGGARGNLANSEINTGLLRRFAPRNDKKWVLQTTPLFDYLINNIHKDKRRLAATAQLYIAKGLCKIIKNHDLKFMSARHSLGAGGIHDSCFAAGGMTNNKIISAYLEKQGVYLARKIPRGDEGIAFGQIVYYLLK